MKYLIELEGTIPSKKNSKQMICRGKRPMLIPSKAYNEWHPKALEQLREQGLPQDKLESVSMTYQFYAPNRRKFDVSNKEESVNDLLVDYGFLLDDNFMNIIEKKMHKVIIDKRGGVTIEVEVVDSYE